VFKNKVTRMFEFKEEVTGGWKGLHGEGLRNMYYGFNGIKIFPSRKMRPPDSVGKWEIHAKWEPITSMELW
jgi:hypothetical protein